MMTDDRGVIDLGPDSISSPAPAPPPNVGLTETSGLEPLDSFCAQSKNRPQSSSMTDTDIQALAIRIRQTLGCGKDLAEDYARGIGEPPEIIHGKILVRDTDGRIIARVPDTVLLG